MARRARSQAASLRFRQKLILTQYLLRLLGHESFETLANHLKAPEIEGLTEDRVSRFHLAITAVLPSEADLTPDQLLAYDENIVRHSLSLRMEERGFSWKYFQYLALLFTEIYLDRWFRDRDRLLTDLNRLVASHNAAHTNPVDQVDDYTDQDLRKLAIWSATGSGKTLLLHMNILQFRHYMNQGGRRRAFNRVILITPNEGLSRQHLEEFGASRIQAELFDKDGGSLFAGDAVEVIDIHKLKEDSKEKTVAVDAFETNNLVLIDEGHRGSGGTTWRDMRRRLAATGFAFEYSATFEQAVKAVTSRKREIEQEYLKSILIDYSYRWFYGDGYGKDYRILNLADDTDDDRRRLYLTACLLTFYQQCLVRRDQGVRLRPYLIDQPLLVFVGGRVTAVRKQGGRDVSDVLDVLLFLAEFVANQADSVRLLDRLRGGRPGLLDQRGREIFHGAFPYVLDHMVSAENLYADILRTVFNSASRAALHVVHLKGSDGEIALRLGENEPFGVINVGDAAKLVTLCEDHASLLNPTEQPYASSLFRGINASDSTINILIGSKKFTEGWSSWRVSTMGLMNIGRNEGSEIIQLFGRGVRLRGFEFSLKRHTYLGHQRDEYLAKLETLNIFGVRADYMKQFQDFLADEGLGTEDETVEITLPVVNLFDAEELRQKGLKVIRLREDIDFKRQTKIDFASPPEGFLPRRRVTLDWYPKIQAELSKGANRGINLGTKQESKLSSQHLAFLDLEAIYLELLEFKNQRAWFNLNIGRDAVAEMLRRSDWYTLYIPKAELEFTSFAAFGRWQEIAIALLKKYADRLYSFLREEWEAPYVEYVDLSVDDPNFVEKWTVSIEETQEALIGRLTDLAGRMNGGDYAGFEFGDLRAIFPDPHLYKPLVSLAGDDGSITVRPVPLNEGEASFVDDLIEHFERNRRSFDGSELYLLRNQSRGRGIGFFEAGNFYPDFILWLIRDGRQFVTFIDPKGIRNLSGPGDEKILFGQRIKEIEGQLHASEPSITLNSFILSNTPLEEVRWWDGGMSEHDFEEQHVLFQVGGSGNYVEKLFARIN